MIDESAAEVTAGPEAPSTPKGPWGPWETVLLGLVVAGSFVVVQTLVAAVFAVIALVSEPEGDFEKLAAGLELDGDLLGLSTCLTGVLSTGCIFLLVWLRKGPSIRDYLDLKKFGLPVFLKWLGITAVFLAASDGVRVLLGRPIVPEFMVTVYESAFLLPVLWIALVVGAPVFEEMFFRGFLFRGFLGSRLGEVGTIAVTSLLWTAIHVQYGLVDLASIFFIGLLLGLARLRSGSIYLPIALHAINNLVATIQTAWHVRTLAGG